MAIDSKLKRASIVSIGLLFTGPGLALDGTIDQADRQAIGYSYAGILAGAGPASTKHVRNQIRDAVVVALTGLTETGSNVFTSRSVPLGTALPAICIYTSEEETDYSLGRADCAPMRVLTLTVEGYHSGDDDDQLDQIAVDVETALFADKTLGGLCHYIDGANQEIERDGEGEKATGMIRMAFTVGYRVQDGAPTVPV